MVVLARHDLSQMHAMSAQMQVLIRSCLCLLSFMINMLHCRKSKTAQA